MKYHFTTKLLLTFTIVLIVGCGTLFLVDKNCFDISNELKLFPGIVGETIAFTSSKGGSRLLRIIKKYANHISGYTTDTGCSCYDYWNVEIGDNVLTISFSTSLQYLANAEGTRSEIVAVSNSGTNDTMTEANKAVHTSFIINGQTLETVLEYRKTSTNANQIQALYFVKSIGLAMIIFNNGDTLTNSNLSVSNVSGTDTWDYYEQRCE